MTRTSGTPAGQPEASGDAPGTAREAQRRRESSGCKRLGKMGRRERSGEAEEKSALRWREATPVFFLGYRSPYLSITSRPSVQWSCLSSPNLAFPGGYSETLYLGLSPILVKHHGQPSCILLMTVLRARTSESE